MKRKIFLLLTIFVLIFSIALPVFAEDTIEPKPELDPNEAFLNELAEFVDKCGDQGKSTIIYTSDSIRTKGVTLEPYFDILTRDAGFKIVINPDFGIEVYDDVSTDYIDGIRVNGHTIDDLTVHFDLDTPTAYTVEVRLVYKEGILGDLAKISDDNYDWSKLLENPVALLMGLYYLFAIGSIVVASVAALCSKKHKVKSANDIAELVDERASAAMLELRDRFCDILDTKFLPMLTGIVNTNQSVVKAITLSTSKDHNAPLALLDTLNEVSGTDVAKVIEDAKTAIRASTASAQDHKEKTLDALRAMKNAAKDIASEVTNVKKEDDTPSVF